MSIKVSYIYSACILIETPNVKIVCDPWFTPGAFDGAWHHYPPCDHPIEVIGECDIIYISHIHPDHYDPEFLREYLKRYTPTILIADFKHNYLAKKMTIDGIPHEVTNYYKVGDTEIGLFPHNDDDPHEIDSAMAVKWKDHAVANMNDNCYSEEQLDRVKAFADHYQIGLMGYAAASAYPQRFYDDEAIINEKKKATIEKCKNKYLKMAAYLNPDKRIPFAGKYILGGRHWHLTKHMAFVDPLDVKEIDDNVIVLDDYGKGWIDTKDLVPHNEREKHYDVADILRHAETTKGNTYPYDVELASLNVDRIPYKRLFASAYKNALRMSATDKDWYLCVKLIDDWFVGNMNKNKAEMRFVKDVSDIERRTEITVDLKYLFGLLTCLYHWNNAFGGSHYDERRYPDEFDPQVENFVNFLHV